jgi:hypothetical protein
MTDSHNPWTKDWGQVSTTLSIRRRKNRGAITTLHARMRQGSIAFSFSADWVEWVTVMNNHSDRIVTVERQILSEERIYLDHWCRLSDEEHIDEGEFYQSIIESKQGLPLHLEGLFLDYLAELIMQRYEGKPGEKTVTLPPPRATEPATYEATLPSAL